MLINVSTGVKGCCHIRGTGDSVYSSTVEYMTPFHVTQSEQVVEKGEHEFSGGCVHYEGPRRGLLVSFSVIF